MAATSSRRSSQAKVRAHCRRLRAQGLRPIQIWVPDARAPGFKAQHRQSLAVATSLQENEDQSFIDAVSDLCLKDLPEGGKLPPHATFRLVIKITLLSFAVLLAGCSSQEQRLLQQSARDDLTCKKSHVYGTENYWKCRSQLDQLHFQQQQQSEGVFGKVIDGVAGVTSVLP